MAYDEAQIAEVHEGKECQETADLAHLSPLDDDPFDAWLGELLALPTESLSAFDDGDGISGLNLESFLAPGGGWGGSETPVRRAIRVGTANGLTVTSLKRSSGNTGSDHHVSQRNAFAADMSNGVRPTPQMLRTAQQIAAAMGYRWPSNGYLNTATTPRGYRAQLIYNSSVVPDHHNHVHFGVKKVR